MSSELRSSRVGVLALAIAIILPAAAHAQNQAIVLKPKSPPPAHEIQVPAVEKNLKVFDVLDFDVFNHPAHRQAIRASHGHHRTLGQRHDGS